MSDKLEPEEGDKCLDGNCHGHYIMSESENCQCHIDGMAPCSSCMSTYIYCDTCKYTPEEVTEAHKRSKRQ